MGHKQKKTPFYTEEEVRGRQPYEPGGEKLSTVRKYEPSIFVRIHKPFSRASYLWAPD